MYVHISDYAVLFLTCHLLCIATIQDADCTEVFVSLELSLLSVTEPSNPQSEFTSTTCTYMIACLAVLGSHTG